MRTRISRSVCRGLALALAVWLCSRVACAQELVVVEGSAQDSAAADKLAELVTVPFARAAAGADPCAEGARFALFLDSAQYSVRLVRCGDGTELARAVDPEAARRTPYLAAFVAAELWGLNAELERAAAPAPPATLESEAAAAPLPAASGAAAPVVEPAAAAPRGAALHFALGAELIAAGPPFSGALRPVLSVGASGPHSLGWLFELSVAPFARGEVTRDSERIELDRHDVRLGGGVLYRSGALSLAGTAFGRASLTDMAYDDQTTSQLRWGLGASLRIELSFASWLAAWAGVLADFATSWTVYRVGGAPWDADPKVLVAASAGLLLRVPL
ncbi:MAG TPA: hypothetical protein VJR89_11750 [Polyangiales bacterium]|nr:hypothetical protein [Polyangiales bacterium]